MLVKSIQKIWSATSTTCAAVLAPGGFLISHCNEKFPISLLFDYMQAADGVDFFFSKPRHFGDGGRQAPIASILYDIGFWAFAGIPYLLGKVIDFGLGYSWEQDGIFSNALKIIAGIPGATAGGGLVIAGAILFYVLPTVVLGGVDLGLRLATAASGLALSIAGLAIDTVLVGAASVLTAIVGVVGLVAGAFKMAALGIGKICGCFDNKKESADFTPEEFEGLVFGSNSLINTKMPGVGSASSPTTKIENNNNPITIVTSRRQISINTIDTPNSAERSVYQLPSL